MNKILLLLLLFIVNFSTVFSQDQPMEAAIEKIISKGKEAIIQMAFELIEDRFPSLEITSEEYEISVWANQKEVMVKFKRLVRYEQRGIHYEYDLSVDVLNRKISPFDIWGARANFFVPTQPQKETLAYLTKLMNLPVRSMENVISEDDKNYYVTFYSKGGHSLHIINKATGEHLEPLDVTYAVLPTPAFDSLSPNSSHPENQEDTLREINH